MQKKTYEYNLLLRLSKADLQRLESRSARFGKSKAETIRLCLRTPIKSDSISLKLQPLFETAELYKAALDSIALYEAELDESSRQSLRKKAIDLRRQLLREIDLLRAIAEVGRLADPSALI